MEAFFGIRSLDDLGGGRAGGLRVVMELPCTLPARNPKVFAAPLTDIGWGLIQRGYGTHTKQKELNVLYIFICTLMHIFAHKFMYALVLDVLIFS